MRLPNAALVEVVKTQFRVFFALRSLAPCLKRSVKRRALASSTEQEEKDK